jgi:hypothetical protein
MQRHLRRGRRCRNAIRDSSVIPTPPTPPAEYRFSSLWRRCALLVGAAVLVLPLLAAGPAAAEDEDDDLTFEQRIIRNLLGGGRPGIDYRERSPLVIPPSQALPSPDASAVAAGNPAWPRDPDQTRRQGNSRRSSSSPVIDEFRAAAEPLSPGEMRRGARAGAGRVDGPVMSPSESQMGRVLTPAELGETRSLFGSVMRAVTPEKPATFTGEPTRRRLTQPPTGYQTPASGQAYAPPSSRGVLGSIPNIFDRTTPTSER